MSERGDEEVMEKNIRGKLGRSSVTEKLTVELCSG